MKKTILVTGGSGYIGSHTCLELLNEGHDVIVLDDLSNSNEKALANVEDLTGKRIILIQGDVRNMRTVAMIFHMYDIDAVIHFAGLKSVGESTTEALRYYDVNISGTINLLRCMEDVGVHRLVFSSSATVYESQTGEGGAYTEFARTRPINPYGQTKLMGEQILQDVANSDPKWHFSILRYFNPVGAHQSGLIGEAPQGTPSNLAPFIAGVLAGKYEEVKVFGNSYPTRDGTGERDYIHVVDLARAHTRAVDSLFVRDPGTDIYNLGTGVGTTVMELMAAFSEVSGMPVPYSIVPPRTGDVASCLADPEKAYRELDWEAEYDVLEMCADAWHWQVLNPNGYDDLPKS